LLVPVAETGINGLYKPGLKAFFPPVRHLSINIEGWKNFTQIEDLQVGQAMLKTTRKTACRNPLRMIIVIDISWISRCWRRRTRSDPYLYYLFYAAYLSLCRRMR
jgi:hypothetical protein